MTIKKMINYRNIWMGTAMLWIMLSHTRIILNSSILAFIKNIGYGGVDIFPFASGIGNYYSYLRDKSPLEFLKRRIWRLAPTYVLFILIWGMIEFIRGNLKPVYIITNLFGIQGFSSQGTVFNWYITVLIICYLLTPYIATFIHDYKLLHNCIFVCILIMLSIAFWWDRKFIISATRIPIYVIGMIFAKYDYFEINKRHAVVLISQGIAGIFILSVFYKYLSAYLWSCGLHWYPFILITPFLCYTISLGSIYMETNRIFSGICASLTFIGKNSFELYLVHCYLFVVIEYLIKNNILNNSLYIWLTAFVESFIGASLLKIIRQWCVNVFLHNEKNTNFPI